MNTEETKRPPYENRQAMRIMRAVLAKSHDTIPSDLALLRADSLRIINNPEMSERVKNAARRLLLEVTEKELRLVAPLEHSERLDAGEATERVEQTEFRAKLDQGG